MADETRAGGGEQAPSRRRGATVAEALALLPGAGGARFAKVLEHGSLLVEIYAPRGRDPQQPHTRDEAYVVVAGSGEFVNGDRRHAFGPGDFLFVPAASRTASRTSPKTSSSGSSSTAPKAGRKKTGRRRKGEGRKSRRRSRRLHFIPAFRPSSPPPFALHPRPAPRLKILCFRRGAAL